MNAMPSTLVATLGWALIHFLWQGLLVGMATALALLLLRQARPQARYAVTCAALALCLALPVLGVWHGLQTDASVAAASAPDNAHFVVVAGQTAVVPLSWQATLQGRLPSVVALWSIGAGLFALRMALGMLWVGRIGRSRAHIGDQSWQTRLDRLATAFGMRGEIRLRVVDDLDSPVAAGWWRPMVLVPAMLVTRMSPDLLEALLAHELAHIKRHDYLVNLLQSAIEALLFYHPVVWWLSRQIRIEREQIADDLAATALGEPRRLALALQALDKIQLDNCQFDKPIFPSQQPALAANGGNLMTRIQRLIRPSQHALSWKMALPILGLAAFCLTVYAHDGIAVAPGSKVASTSSETHTTGRLSLSGNRQADAYALIRAGQDGMVMSGDTRDIPAIEKVKAKVSGDFIWARHGQKTYVVQDPAIIAKVIEIRRPADARGVGEPALGAGDADHRGRLG